MVTEYIEEFELPSRCLLYEEEDNIPEVISMRAMTTKEEKMLIGSTGNSAFDKVIGACIVEPKNIPLGKLLIPDKHFLLLKLRILSYGSSYHATYKCPDCGESHEYSLDLDELEIHELADDFVEPIEFELPMSGDSIGIRLLRDKDNKKVENKAKRLKRKAKGAMTGDISYILRLAEHLVLVNGEEIPANKKQAYVESMHSRDSAYIRHQLNSIELGYDLQIYEDCPFCGSEVEFTLPMTEEFFRPRF